MTVDSPMLKVTGLEAGYAQSKVLFGVSLEVAAGEVVTLLGRNGMGKTTTISSVIGLVRPTAGSVQFCDQRLEAKTAFRNARSGIGLVPEGRHIFPNLSVRENLLVVEQNRRSVPNPWTLRRVIELFPGLKPRMDSPGSLLSGGEQQMLAIGRALITNPRLLILDEATEGLAPLVRAEIWRVLRLLKEQGQSILVVDKNVDALSQLAERHYILEKGRVVWSGSTAELIRDPSLKTQYLGI